MKWLGLSQCHQIIYKQQLSLHVAQQTVQRRLNIQGNSVWKGFRVAESKATNTGFGSHHSNWNKYIQPVSFFNLWGAEYF